VYKDIYRKFLKFRKETYVLFVGFVTRSNIEPVQ